MKVEIRFFANLREIVGKKVETVEFPEEEEISVERVLQQLVNLYGEGFVDFVFNSETGEIEDYLTFMVNGKSIATLQGIKTKVKNDDVLAILPPVGGG
ncbi:MAG: ubiquitin-like small modifier protein 1 [Thermoproteota archaeon]